MQRIAIVGIGCRFPGGVDSAATFWSLLTNDQCAISEIPAHRWSLDGFYNATPDLPNRSYSKWAGFLDDIRSFDATYFGLSPREAAAMDPQQRLLLMVAREAAWDARLPLRALRQARAGVFIGVSNTDYGLLQRYRDGTGDIQAGTGTALSIVANRVSNRLDLPGPSMGIDTACSSSLVALDTACRHLMDATCDVALAGGVSILLDPRMFITFSRARMLSPTGRIRAFDAAADGFVRGEGVGVVVLRRLSDALAAGDRIYAVIEATGVNQDGRTGTITEPSLAAQIAMMQTAAERAGIAPDDLDYAEAHGTGTPVGDPIEARAIGTVFGGRQRNAPLAIGSVKTNIGHLEPAAGIAGLIKAALVLHHRHIPASLGFERPNAAIDFDGLGLEVAHRPRDLGAGPSRLHALVNAFGFGGTNACALLRSADAQCPPSAPRLFNGRAIAQSSGNPAPPVAVPLSAPSESHLQAFAASLAASLANGAWAEGGLREIAGALSGQNDHAVHRAVILASTPEQFRERLEDLAAGRHWTSIDRQAAPEMIVGRAKTGRKLVFTMTGQGGQWWAMGRELLQQEPVFRRTVEAFDADFAAEAGWSILDALLADETSSRIHDAAVTPAVMFAFQAGLAALWRSRGVTPDIVLGHSFGEVTAAYLAGAIAPRAVARLVRFRGLIRGAVDRAGTMAAIGLGAEAIAPLLPADGSIEIGGYNAPDMVTLTGNERAIDTLIARLATDDPSILTSKLALDFAYHSSWFAPAEGRFKTDVGRLETLPPQLPVISTVTGDLNDRFDTDYWWQNLRQPVLYQKAVERALDLGADTFVELGPHRTLSSMTAACAAARGQNVVTVSTLDRRWGDATALAVATAQLYVAGTEVDWQALHGTGSRLTALPNPPWCLHDHWNEPEEARIRLRQTHHHPLLGRSDPGPERCWSSEVSLATHAFLGDHRLDGEVVFPAAAYLDMLAAAAREILQCAAIELSDIAMPAALYLGADEVIQLHTRFDPARQHLSISSRCRDGTEVWERRAKATIYPFHGHLVANPRSSDHPDEALDVAEFYRAAETRGYVWGPRFRCLQSITRWDGCAAARISVPPLSQDEVAAFALDPRTVDSALQLLLACESHTDPSDLIPVAISRVIISGALESDATAWMTTSATADGLRAQAEIAAADGTPILRIEGLHARRRRSARPGEAGDAVTPRIYRDQFEPLAPAPAAPVAAGAWLIIAAEQCGVAARLAEELTTRGGHAEVRSLSPAAASRFETFTAIIRHCLEAGPLAGIVYALPPSRPVADFSDIGRVAYEHTLCLTAFGQAAARIADEEPMPPISILTRGARAIGDQDSLTDAGLAQSVLLGTARTIAMETPSLSIRLIDMDADAPGDIAGLPDALAAAAHEPEILLRAGRAYGARLALHDAQDLPPATQPAARLAPGCNFALRHQGPPGQDGLVWQEAAASAPRADQVTVEVRAVGLNFRDVMAVSGLLPEHAEPTPALGALGLEFSGVVVARGVNVRDLAVGDHVIGMGRGALQRRFTLPQSAIHRAPAGLSHTAAATIPSAYLTTHHALNKIARLRPGESVLVHSATGGVGLAAMALARRAGARVLATAGSAEKQAYLRQLGVSDVFSSRDLAFSDDVLRITHGRGVDVILNALGGAFIDKGLACLAPYGRFLELGKRDIHEDLALGLKHLRRNISFHVIDLAALIEERPEQAADLMRDVLAMLAAGEIAPLPATPFDAHAISAAFRLFASAGHIGKIVVNLDDQQLAVQRAYTRGAPLDAEGSYLVTGGASGFGRAVGDWLVRRGAGRVVLAQRSANAGAGRPGAGPIVHQMLDVTDAARVEQVIAVLTHSDKPLRGIIHAAVVYDDALLADMTADRVRHVLAPKVDGALNLTRAVELAGTKLDFFLSCSSLAQVVGWPGQSNYAAANAFLDALAIWQRGRGIPGHCINWGALAESGHVARNPHMRAFLASTGWTGIDDATALEHLARALDCRWPSLTVAATDWRQLATTLPALARAPRFAGLMTQSSASRDTSARGLAGLAGEELQDAALHLVRAEAAKVLRASAEDLAGHDRLDSAGIDSLSSFELRLRIEQTLGHEVPMARFARAARFSDLAVLVAALESEARVASARH